MIVPSRRPRVWLLDFETAVRFTEDCPSENRVSIGLPAGGSIGPSDFRRSCPPEVLAGEPYDPFKLDVWLFGNSIKSYKVRLLPCDSVSLID